jgi:tetratricopeptide (TPR) repeat protein
LLGCCSLLACAEYTHTTRIIDGREVMGRSIVPEAYAAYLAGSALEAQGDPRRAALEYRVAIDADPDSVEIQTALARVTCAFDRGAAEDEFLAALELDPHYEPAHRERSRCALLRQAIAPAVIHAERAMIAAPFEWSATLVMVDALIAADRPEDARRYLWGFLALNPEDPRVLERLRRLGEAVPDEVNPLELALREGDDRAAVAIALERRLDQVELARIALFQARPDFALAHSQMVLFADPSNSDARIVSLLSAFVLGDMRAYRASLRDLWREHTVPSAESAEVMMDLLRARVGGAAAETFARAHERALAAPPALDEDRGALPHEVWQRPRPAPPVEPAAPEAEPTRP